MIKPKKKRGGDANQVAASVVADAIKQSGKKIKAPAVRKKAKLK